MERGKSNTGIAGIDVSKRTLDVAALGFEAQLQVSNDAAGFEAFGGVVA